MNGPAVTLRVWIDLDGDGLFASALDDVSAYVQAATWSIGFREPFQAMADENRATLTLSNVTGAFSPERPFAAIGAALRPYRRVRLEGESALSGTRAPLWTGFVERVTVTPGERGPRAVTVDCAGLKALLNATEVSLPLMEGVTADAVIAEVFTQVPHPPAVGAGWNVGLEGGTELGLTTTLVDETAAYALSAGITVFPFVGDTWDRFTTAWAAIQSVVEADRGRFFFDGSGRAVFLNRHDVARKAASVRSEWGTFDDALSLQYETGEDLVNDVRVTYAGRTRSATADEPLWQLAEPVRVQKSSSREIRARYADRTSGVTVAGRNARPPSGGDFAAVGGNVSVTAFEAAAQSARIELTNSHAHETAEVTTLVVRGEKLTSFQKQEVRLEDAAHIVQFGRRTLTIDAKLLTDADFALNVAQFELFQRRSRSAAVRALRLHAGQKPLYADLAVTAALFDRIRVTEPALGHDAHYLIIGMSHRWTHARDWEIEWRLEPSAAVTVWTLGDAALGVLAATTRLSL